MKIQRDGHRVVSSAKGRGLALAVATAAVVVPGLSRAATITLTTSDVVGRSSFAPNAATVTPGWSDGLFPSAGNAYVVNTPAATQFQLRTPADQATDLVFAGDSLDLEGSATTQSALVLKNLTLTTTTVNNLTLNGGQVQNGGTAAGAATSLTFVSNAITVGPVGGVFNGGAAGRVLTVNAPISGVGGLTIATQGGTVVLNNATANTFAGNVLVNGSGITTAGIPGGALRANDGVQIPTTANLSLAGGILQTSANVTRDGGTAAGEIQIASGVSGFSAVGGDSTVAIGGTAAPTALTWGTAPFAPSILVLNDSAATGTLTFANAINLGTTARSIFNTGTTSSLANLTGALSGSAVLNIYGGGVTTLSGSNNLLTGTINIATNANSATASVNGVLRLNASGAAGTGTINVGVNGNSTTGRLEVAGNSVNSNPIILPGRSTATSVAVQNISGNNELSGTITTIAGGNNFLIQSDSGTLTLSGAGAAANGVAIQSGATSSTRTVTLQGAANGVVSGIIANGTVTAPVVAITKAGSGTWTLTNTNTYTGLTTVAGGTLQLGDGTSGRDGTIGSTSGVVTSAGTSPNVTTGTLAFNRAGTSNTAGYAISGAGNVTKLGAGSQTLNGLNTYTGTTTVQAGTLRATNAAYRNTVLADGSTGGLDVQGGRFVFDYTDAVSPLAQVKSILTAGYAGGFAAGQIRSTARPAGTTIGYGETPNSTVTVRVTLPGDANLDGAVGFDDFVLLQGNFSQSNVTFAQGDFDYNDVVNFNDFVLLQGSFGQSLPGGRATFTREQYAAVMSITDAGQVPEPASLALLGLSAAGLLRRRRGR